ncbi:MAG: ABC transporter substrate-binding protein [Treponema sp.]|jgi:ABC-type glycerol-3-phosphate transport system substrate-binding protein|nr:ABC transporter substrate-binding protein [Treponema sp.]
MKKVLTLAILGTFLLLISVVGCTINTNSRGMNGELTVWSFTDEVEGLLNYYKKAFPEVKINYSLTPTEAFPSKLDTVFASGRGAPDVIALESAFVRKYVESGFLLDITAIADRNRSKLLQYPIDVGTYNGKVYGMSWQACPGAFFYRRSLARKYLGSDEPTYVQTLFMDLNRFLDAARRLKTASNGSCVVVASLGDLQIPFYSARSQPWVVNNRLVLDPILDQYLEISKTLRDERLEGRVGQWSEGWFAGMRGELRDNRGNLLEVFGYFLPTWGLQYVLKSEASRTAGDWAMIPGPIPYRWGGTWLGAYKGTRNPEGAVQMIEWLTTNDDFLRQYVMATGDMVTNTNVLNSIKANIYEPFLGGQNSYAEFAEIALYVNGRPTQQYDDIIQALFQEAITAYVNGEKSKAQAIADFRRQVSSQIGIN